MVAAPTCSSGHQRIAACEQRHWRRNTIVVFTFFAWNVTRRANARQATRWFGEIKQKIPSKSDRLHPKRSRPWRRTRRKMDGLAVDLNRHF
jgi:hypothetical protein